MNEVLSFICVLSGFVSKLASELRLCYVSQADPDNLLFLLKAGITGVPPLQPRKEILVS